MNSGDILETNLIHFQFSLSLVQETEYHKFIQDMIDRTNLSLTDLNRPIYRVFQLERFLDLFISRTNVLIDTKKWDDPFENSFFTIPRRDKNGRTMSYGYGQFFGQCWTLNVETDFMWRVYTSNKDSVKVKSTISKLITSLESSTEYIQQKNESERITKEWEEEGTGQFVFEFEGSITKVKYLKDKEFVKLNNSRRLGIEYFSNPMSMKRYEFRHEKEIRIILYYMDSDLHSSEYIYDDMFSYHIDPNLLFDEIVFDPRMNVNKYLSFKMFLENNGFKNKIKQSSLYKLPFRNIEV